MVVMSLQVRVNLPNSDMVGHTGDIEATVVACKAADDAVKVMLAASFCFNLSLKFEEKKIIKLVFYNFTLCSNLC